MKRILSYSLALSLCLLLPLLVGGCGPPSGPVQVSLNIDPPNPRLDGSSQITAIVTNARGRPVSGKTVAFTWKVSGSKQSEQAGVTSTTDTDGKAAYTQNGNGDRRAITVTATVDGVSQSVDVQFGEVLPSGFIALASIPMYWGDAKAYCQQQGGRLPRMNKSNFLAWDDRGLIYHIEGFGDPGDRWPSGLPNDSYWMGTLEPHKSGFSWLIAPRGKIGIIVHLSSLRVACVPR